MTLHNRCCVRYLPSIAHAYTCHFIPDKVRFNEGQDLSFSINVGLVELLGGDKQV